MYEIYLELQKLLNESPKLGRLSVQRSSISREDSAGWKIDYFETHIKFINNKGEQLLDKEAASALFGSKLDRRSGGVLSKWLSR